MPFDKEHGFQLVDKMRGIAEGGRASKPQGREPGMRPGEKGADGPAGERAGGKGSVAQVAIAWLLSKKIVSSVIVGASKPQQLDDNLAAAELHLANDELTVLDEFTKPASVYPNWFTELVRDPAVEKALKG